MGNARAETTIAKPADEVWGVIGDYGNLGWMPGVDTCELDPANENDRILGMFGMRIVERQLARDEAGRTLTYGIVDGDMKPETHEATITVVPDGDAASQVTWDVTTDDGMVEVMQGAYQGALDALKKKLEG